jgi:transcriptional regulator with XRE-family HTH domain
MKIGQRLRKLRTSRGWSQDKLARHSGVTSMTVQRTELGQTTPQLPTIEKLAAALGVAVQALLSDDACDEAAANDDNRAEAA